MTQRDRDRLIALKKAKKGVITQRQAADEIGQTERHIRRLLVELKREGDQAVIHGRRGKRSNRKLDEKSQAKAVAILGQEKYRGFGPTLASEYLGKHHQITVSRETVRTWMIEARLWRSRKQRVEKVRSEVSRVRPHAGQRIPWQASPDHSQPRNGEDLDDRSAAMAVPETKSGESQIGSIAGSAPRWPANTLASITRSQSAAKR